MQQNFTVTTPIYVPSQPLESFLWPDIEAFAEGHLEVSSLHSIWFAQFGNPQGVPVLVVHGGPGGSCGPRDMRFFDPAFYRIILVDQRGAGRSVPSAETRENTTHDLIANFERVRAHLGVSQWLLFGGSWGSALSLAYSQMRPASCLGLILRGVFLGTRAEYLQLWNGMGDLYPEEFEDTSSFCLRQKGP